MLWNCLEEDLCLMHGEKWEFEWLKTPRTTAGELQKIVESRGQKTLKNCPTSPHVVWEGLEKNYPSSSKNNLQHIQLSDTTGTSNETGFYGQIKQQKKNF